MDDAIGVSGDFRIMGDNNQSQPLLLIEPAQEGHHFRADLRVEVARRLVGQDQGRFMHQGAGNGRALLLAAG